MYHGSAVYVKIENTGSLKAMFNDLIQIGGLSIYLLENYYYYTSSRRVVLQHKA